MYNVAVDGPAGAGKSSVARAAAEKLKIVYVDTGALYRAIGVHTMKNGIDTKDAENISKLLETTSVDLKFVDGVQLVLVNGKDVSGEIRTPEASMAASNVSAIPVVREFLFETQKKIARENSVIMDGRDIGTVVLPDAEVKIFLTASAESRAMRRFKELEQKGTPSPFEEVLEDMKQRDYNDTHRDISPLKCADDAVSLDTTGMSLQEEIDAVVKIIIEKMPEGVVQ